VLWIIDKFAGAKHLVDEMTLVQTPKVAPAAPVEAPQQQPAPPVKPPVKKPARKG
jgi:hypothetical protein